MSNEHTFGQDIIEFREQFMRDNPDITWMGIDADVDSGVRWRVAISCSNVSGNIEHLHGMSDLEGAALECLRRARFLAGQVAA